MFKGFYNLTSGMMTQRQRLNNIANNITNISTPGFKVDRHTIGNFEDVLYSRVGNQNKSDYQPIGRQSYIVATDEIVTDYTQGALEETGIPLDIAIDGEGFFAIRNEAGETKYTRAGSFSLDEQGYLCYSDFGRVLGSDGNEIRVMTDKITGDADGNIYATNGILMGRIGVFTFDDTAQLEYNDEGFLVGAEGQADNTAVLRWGFLERSNVDMVSQMTEMLSSQRAFQSAAQVTKIYDTLMNKITSEIGRM
mgnify:CR=1 FL=1